MFFHAFKEVDKLIYNSSDFTVSAYAKLGVNEIYKKPYRVHRFKGRQLILLPTTDLVSIAFILNKVLFLLIKWRINTSVGKCITHPFTLIGKFILIF